MLLIEEHKHTLMSPISTLQILKDIKDSLHLGTAAGICYEFKQYHNYGLLDCMIQAGINWRTWPEFSGNNVYPVPSSDYDLSAEECFELHKYGTYFNQQTKYGQSRIRLLDWLIQQFELVVENMNEQQDNS